MHRALPQKLQDAVLSAIPFSGICFRNVAQQFATQQTILSAKGSLLAGGRFNFRGAFPVLYLSCDLHTCLEETTQAFRQSGSTVAQALPRTVVGIEVGLNRVLDLTAPMQRRRLGVTKASLTGADWVMTQDAENREALTQELGRLARNAGFEALLVPSAALPRTGKNLVIFSEQLLPHSYCHIVNKDRLPLI